MKRIVLLVTFIIIACSVSAQRDSSLFKRVLPDTAKISLNMDAAYNRAFLQVGKLADALGGYIEAHAGYLGEDGVTEGGSFRLARLTLFVAVNIRNRTNERQSVVEEKSVSVRVGIDGQ